MSKDLMREQFEAAIVEQMTKQLMIAAPSLAESDAKIMVSSQGWMNRKGDDYELTVPRMAWWAWRASRDAVVVELPSAIESPPYACFQSGWNDMRGEAVDAIEAQGLKVAP